MPVKAVLFDLDGTLRDSRPAILPSAQYALEHFGYRIADASVLLRYSHSLRTVHEAFVPHAQYEDFSSVYYAKVASLLHTVTPYDGHIAVLAHLKQSYMVGMVSSSRYAKESADTDGIGDLLDVCVGGPDTENHKPHPEPILLALTKLHILPKDAVMVGDLPADIAASKAAGLCAAVGITHGFGTRHMLQQAGADYLIDSLAEIVPTLAIIENHDGS